jgi:outer membrane scaffolding protein for murein synthesis (MipA/OmpV family)
MKILLILLTLISPALAKNKYKFGIGAGVSYANNFVGNKTSSLAKNGKYGANVFPALSFEYKGFAIRGIGAQYSFFGRRNLFDFKLNVRYFGPKYENDYIAKRSPSIFGGATLRLFLFNFRYNTDLSSKSNGAIFDAFAMVPIRLHKKLLVLPKIGAEKFSENFLNYYYSVNAQEAVEFSAYNFKSSSDLVPLISLTSIYFPTESIALRLILTYRSLTPEITASPLINGNDQFSTVFMSIFTF